MKEIIISSSKCFQSGDVSSQTPFHKPTPTLSFLLAARLAHTWYSFFMNFSPSEARREEGQCSLSLSLPSSLLWHSVGILELLLKTWPRHRNNTSFNDSVSDFLAPGAEAGLHQAPCSFVLVNGAVPDRGRINSSNAKVKIEIPASADDLKRAHPWYDSWSASLNWANSEAGWSEPR